MKTHIDPNEKCFLSGESAPGGRGAKDLWLYIVALVGAAVAVIPATMMEGDGVHRFLLAYLIAFAFVFSLSMGSLFFVFITHLCRAGWAPIVRRPAEIMAANIRVVAILFLPIAISVISGHGKLYPWAQPDSALVGAHADAAEHGDAEVYVDAVGRETVIALVAAEAGHGEDEHAGHDHAGHDAGGHDEAGHDAHDAAGHGDGHGAVADHGLEIHVVQNAAGDWVFPHQVLDDFTMKKRPWLSQGWFIGRWIFFFVVWTSIAWWYLRNSLAVDRTGDYLITQKLEKWSAPIALIFALTFTFAAFDLMMSLNPHWYSTMFGVYYFAGTVISTFAALILIFLGLQACGFVKTSVTVEHYHDLGKLLFAFVFFWTYVGFSQYMLLWYASLPETVMWLQHRGVSMVDGQTNGWACIILLLLFGHFMFPFLGLLSRHVKRSRKALAFFAIWMLVMHYTDMYWLVMPEIGPNSGPVFGLIEIGTFAFVLAVFGIGALRLASKHSLVVQRDPRMADTLNHENLY